MVRVQELELLELLVGLRRAVAETREPATRRVLRDTERRLRTALGPAVPKRLAARLLGVSVTALDGWIDRGRIPVVRKSGSSRLELESGPLLELAEVVLRLRAEGMRRGLLARALDELSRRDDPAGRQVLPAEVAVLPRPNMPAGELRARYADTTPEQRVAEAAELSRSVSLLAG